MRRIVLAGMALLTVSACSDKGADSDKDGKVSDQEAMTEMSSGGAFAMKPGQWETTVKFDTFEGKSIPPQVLTAMKTNMAKGITTKSCLTKAQVEKPGSDFFGAPADANCNFDELNRSGNTIKVTMTCSPQKGIMLKNKMDGKFEPETYSMGIEQVTTGTPMGAMTMKGTIAGRRIGDCPA